MEQCGGLKDKFDVSWQVMQSAMDRMMSSGDEAARARVVQVFMPMKKFIIADLERVYAGS